VRAPLYASEPVAKDPKEKMKVKRQRSIEGDEVRSFGQAGPVLPIGWQIAVLILFLATVPFPIIAQDQPKTVVAIPAYLNPDLPVDQRVDDLVSRMTLKEKTSQAVQRSAAHIEDSSFVQCFVTKHPLSGGFVTYCS
jgi:hypothetical protein